jgi:hypothetical protein
VSSALPSSPTVREIASHPFAMAASRTKFLCWETPGTGAHVIVELNWDKAPKTCEALLERCFPTQRTDLTTVHGRHSGMEALFITPGEPIRNVGDENETTDFAVGDVLFCYEPKGACVLSNRQHQ